MESFQEAVWTEPTFSRSGLKRPVSMQAGMLDFNPTKVNYSMISKFCSTNQRIQRLAILELSLVNPEKISDFFNRMKTDARFRNYYLTVYDALRILHRRIFDEPSDIIVQSDEHWSSKLEVVLEEERRALERCQEEIISRQSRLSWLEQVQADELRDRYHWRQGLVPLCKIL